MIYYKIVRDLGNGLYASLVQGIHREFYRIGETTTAREPFSNAGYGLFVYDTIDGISVFGLVVLKVECHDPMPLPEWRMFFSHDAWHIAVADEIVLGERIGDEGVVWIDEEPFDICYTWPSHTLMFKSVKPLEVLHG